MTSKTAAKSAVHARASTPDVTGQASSTTQLGGRVDAPDPSRSEGQRLLRERPETHAAIGAAIGATKQAVCNWRNGDRVPDEKWRRKLYAAFDIPADAWGRLLAVDGIERKPKRVDDEESDGDESEQESEEQEQEPSIMDDCDRLLKSIRKQLARPDLLAREHLQLSESFSRALQMKHRLERERETSEDRTIREHPKWRALKSAIIAALVPHPEAARAVEEAINRIIAEEKRS